MRLVVYRDTPVRLPISRLHRLFEVIVKAEGKARWSGSVNLIVTTDQQVRKLNRRFRSLDRTTDVLAFNLDPPDQPGGVFGEIYISAAHVKRQAREFGSGIWKEYLLLFCHGLLHLFGYDHARKNDQRIMFNLQSKYLNRSPSTG